MTQINEMLVAATTFGDSMWIPGLFIIGLLCLFAYFHPKHTGPVDWGVKVIDLSTEKDPDRKIVMVDMSQIPASMTPEQYLDYVRAYYPTYSIQPKEQI